MKKARGKRKKGRKRVAPHLSVGETDNETEDTRKYNYIDIIDIPKDDFFGLWYSELDMRPVKPHPTPILAFIFFHKKQAVEAKEKLQQGLLRLESDEEKSQVSFTTLEDIGYLFKLKTQAGTIETYAPVLYVERFLFCLASSYLYVVTTGYPKEYKPPFLLEPALFKRTIIVDGKIYIGEEFEYGQK